MSNGDDDNTIDLFAVSERFRKGLRPHIADRQEHEGTVESGEEVEGGEEDELLAYVEVMWGFQTWQCHTAIRDIEALRRGTEKDKALRHPETDHEKILLLVHLRSLANDLARDWGLSDFIRLGDDLHTQPEKVAEESKMKLEGTVVGVEEHEMEGFIVLVVELTDGTTERVVMTKKEAGLVGKEPEDAG